MKKWLALFLAMAMCFSLFAGCEQKVKDDKGEKDKVPVETTQATEATTGETTEPVTEPTEPPPREQLIPDLGEDEEILTFRYEDKYEDLFYEKLEEFEAVALAGEDALALDYLMQDLDELEQFMQDQTVITEILSYCNTKDEEASQLYLDMVEIVTDMADAEIETMRRVYESDSAFKEQVFADWTQEDIDYMLGYTSEIKDMTNREEEILVDYREMSDKEKQEDIGKYYAEIAANNNWVAQNYGYDNFYEYSYELIRDRDYTTEDVQKLRTYTQEYLVDLYVAAITSFYEATQSFDEHQYNDLLEFVNYMEGDYDESEIYEGYMEQLPEDISEQMLSMLDDYVIFPKSSKARPGAFTTLVGGHPFCYFSKDYKTASTIVHEMGHYYAGLQGDLMDMPLDIAEIHSQGNEWLMMAYAYDMVDEEIFQCYLDYKLLDSLSNILISVIIDEFEEKVYTSENLKDFDTKDFERLMEEVCENYGGIDFITEGVVDIQMYWREVVLESQVYYISYAVSLFPSIDLYFLAQEDWDEAVETYKKVANDITGDDTFLAVLEEAGLASPFEMDLYEKLMTHYDMEMPEEESEKAA